MERQFFPLSTKEAKAMGITNHFEFNKGCGFASRLRKLRSDRGVSREKVGNAIGVSKQSIGYYENGETVPTADKLRLLAEFYNVSTDYLLGRSDNETSTELAQKISNATGLTISAIEDLMYYKEHIGKDTLSPALLVNAFFSLGNDFWLSCLVNLREAAEIRKHNSNTAPDTKDILDKLAHKFTLEAEANAEGYHLIEKDRAYLLFRQIANEQMSKITDAAIASLIDSLP